MPDLPIVIPNTASAPKDYTLSGGQELQLKTVRALIDGSGAASAFLPTLQLLDPNGHVMWEGATSSTVAAGGSADVSWFPGLGASTSSGTSSSAWTWAKISVAGFITVTAGTTQILDMHTTNFYTNDPSVFTTIGWLHAGITYNGIQALADGHYLCKGQLQLSGTPAAAGGGFFTSWANNPGFLASYGSGGMIYHVPAQDGGQFDMYVEGLSSVNVASIDPWILQVQNTTGTNVGAYLDYIVVRLDTDATIIS